MIAEKDRYTSFMYRSKKINPYPIKTLQRFL